MLHQFYLVLALLFSLTSVCLFVFSPYEIDVFFGSSTSANEGQIAIGIVSLLVSIVCFLGFFVEYRCRRPNPSRVQLMIISLLSGLFTFYIGLPILRLFLLLYAVTCTFEVESHYDLVVGSNIAVLILNMGVLACLFFAQRAFSTKYPQYTRPIIRDYGANISIVLYILFTIITIFSFFSSLRIGSLQHFPLGVLFLISGASLLTSALGMLILVLLFLLYLLFAILRVINGTLIFLRTTAPSAQSTSAPPRPSKALSICVLVFVSIVEFGSVGIIIIAFFGSIVSTLVRSFSSMSAIQCWLIIGYTAVASLIHIKIAVDLFSASKSRPSDRKSRNISPDRAENADSASADTPRPATVVLATYGPTYAQQQGPFMPYTQMQMIQPYGASTAPGGSSGQLQPIPISMMGGWGWNGPETAKGQQQVFFMQPANPTAGSAVPYPPQSLPAAITIEMQPSGFIDNMDNPKA